LSQGLGSIQRTVVLGARIARERECDRQSQSGDSGIEESILVLHFL
jgi:hypothetical protein